MLVLHIETWADSAALGGGFCGAEVEVPRVRIKQHKARRHNFAALSFTRPGPIAEARCYLIRRAHSRPRFEMGTHHYVWFLFALGSARGGGFRELCAFARFVGDSFVGRGSARRFRRAVAKGPREGRARRGSASSRFPFRFLVFAARSASRAAVSSRHRAGAVVNSLF